MIRMLRYAAVMMTIASPAIAQDASALAEQVKQSANPELIGALSKEMGGATVAQSSGAAGALLGLAKTRLKPEEFTKVSGAIPGIDTLLAAAPAVAGTTGTSGAAGALAKATGDASALGGLAAVAPAFEKLGLKPEMAMKAVPVLTSYVTKTGGEDVASLLAGALK